MGKSAPPPPNYQGAAEAQGKSSQTAADTQTQANRANQTGPNASVQWVKNPDGSWTQTNSLSGPLSGANSALQQQASDNFGSPLDNGSQARQQAIQNIYGSEMGQLNPQFQQQGNQLQAQLAAQGLSPTSEAARAAQNNLSQSQGQQQIGALGEAEREGTAAQQATFNENLAARNMPLEEMQGLQNLGQFQGYNQAGMAQPTQYLPAAMAYGNYELPASAQSQGFMADIAGGGMNLAGSVLNAAGNGMAKGGYTKKPALVGEEGPEIMVPDAGATVIPLKPFGFGRRKK